MPSEFHSQVSPMPSEFQFKQPPLALRIPKSRPWYGTDIFWNRPFIIIWPVFLANIMESMCSDWLTGQLKGPKTKQKD